MNLKVMYSCLAVLVGALTLTMANAVYIRHLQHQTEIRFQQSQRAADLRWCSLLSSLDQPGVPATTERGRFVQKQIHQLVLDLGCEGSP